MRRSASHKAEHRSRAFPNGVWERGRERACSSGTRKSSDDSPQKVGCPQTIGILATSATRRDRDRRAAFTLLEILLVLSVLTVVVSLTWPTLTRYMREQEILEGAEAARAAAVGTRIKAIDTGLTYQFRYEPQGRRFVVVPFDPPETIAASSTDTGTSEVSTYPVLSGQLGIESQFVIPEDEPAVMEGLPPDLFASLPDARDLEATAWGPPILFYPDGSADDALFRIVNEDGLRIDLALRGLTGTVTVGPIFQEATR